MQQCHMSLIVNVNTKLKDAFSTTYGRASSFDLKDEDLSGRHADLIKSMDPENPQYSRRHQHSWDNRVGTGINMVASVSTLSCFQAIFVNSFSRKYSNSKMFEYSMKTLLSFFLNKLANGHVITQLSKADALILDANSSGTTTSSSPTSQPAIASSGPSASGSVSIASCISSLPSSSIPKSASAPHPSPPPTSKAPSALTFKACRAVALVAARVIIAPSKKPLDILNKGQLLSTCCIGTGGFSKVALGSTVVITQSE
uniref:Uncharacterized protein n=1 Tax=Glossina pallidipes TaxID=7398 RepID=A0A1A9Z7F1_GLOPL